jgi:hypothetical protein
VVSREDMSAEEKVALAEEWFDQIRSIPAPPFPAYVAPERPASLDLAGLTGVFAITSAMSLHRCAHCKQGIHVGRPHIARRLTPTSAVTDYYHEDCVILP